MHKERLQTELFMNYSLVLLSQNSVLHAANEQSLHNQILSENTFYHRTPDLLYPINTSNRCALASVRVHGSDSY